MNRKIITITFFVFLTFTYAHAQNNEKMKKINFLLSIGTASGNIVNDYETGYNLLGENTKLQIGYSFSQHDAIAIGVGYSELTGNGFNAKGNFYQERNILSIPLLYTRSVYYQQFNIEIGVGLQANKLITDKYHYINETKNNQFSGWNLATKSYIAFLYRITDNAKVGVFYDLSTDLTKYSSTDETYFKGKQRMTLFKSVGLSMGFSF